MEVNVFFIRNANQKGCYFVMPADRPIAIPPYVREGWRYMGVRDSEDPLFRSTPMQARLQEYGYVIVPASAWSRLLAFAARFPFRSRR